MKLAVQDMEEEREGERLEATGYSRGGRKSPWSSSIYAHQIYYTEIGFCPSLPAYKIRCGLNVAVKNITIVTSG